MGTPMGNGVLRAVLSAASASQLTDRELLARFIEGDESAFEVLVNRHSGLVFGVCRRVLPNAQDAEDACQATFLVLARKAKTGRWQLSIANWLYTTARRIASTASRTSARRMKRESRIAPPAPVSALDQMTGREAFSALDEELEKLPSIYREPLVLCHLQGLTRDEAAARLGIPSATLKSQLDRGRKKLADALTKRGIVAGFGFLAVATTSSTGACSPRLNQSILATIEGSPSASVAALIQGIAVNGFSTKLQLILVAAVAVTATGFGIALNSTESKGQTHENRQPPAAKAETKIQDKPNADAKERTIAGKLLGDGSAKEIDLAPYLSLVRISHSEGTSEALILDRWKNEEYEIQMDAKGNVQVTRYSHLAVDENGKKGDVRKKREVRPHLQFGSDDTGNLRRYFVRRILEDELIIQEYSATLESQIKGPIPLAVTLTLRQCYPLSNAKVLPDLTEKMYIWRVGQLLRSDEADRAVKAVTDPIQIWRQMVRPLSPISDADSSAKRSARWMILLKSGSGKEYLEQLHAFKAKIVIPEAPEWKSNLLFEDLADTKKGEKLSNQKLPEFSMTDSDKSSASKIARALGLDYDPPYFIAYFPKNVEEDLAHKENAYRGRKSAEISSTTFRVIPRNGAFEFRVTDQVAVTKIK